MKKLFSTATIIAATIGLGACAGNWDMDRVAGLPDQGNAFQTELHKEYVALARLEASEGDWTDASLFNTLGENAANGMAFGPQNVADRNIPEDAAPAMMAAREKLVAALKAGADSYPAPAARAQAMFDCWMQEQEENFQPEDIANCKAAFEAALAQIGPAKAPSFVLYFDFNSAALTGKSNTTINEAAAYARANPSAGISIVGHTDRAGSNDYNTALSNRRANAAASALKGAGITASRISTASHGETQPAVKTKDGAQEMMNRRVTISFGG